MRLLQVSLFSKKKKRPLLGNSLVVQGLGLQALTAVVQIQFLVKELRSHELCIVAKEKKKKKEKKTLFYPLCCLLLPPYLSPHLHIKIPQMMTG